MEYYFAWWNLENLFDLQDAPQRPAWLQSRLNSELAGWNAEVLDTKLEQIARIVCRLNDGRGPDILGDLSDPDGGQAGPSRSGRRAGHPSSPGHKVNTQRSRAGSILARREIL